MPRRPFTAGELRRGDVFTIHAWKLKEWCVCLATPTRELADPHDGRSAFWEVQVCGWDTERRALTHGGPYIGIPINAHVFLDLDAGGSATAQLAYRDRRDVMVGQ
jgi:hypothetical protein